jgi:hypothetical protein
MIIFPSSCINEHITYGAGYLHSLRDISYLCEFIPDIFDVRDVFHWNKHNRSTSDNIFFSA